MTEQNLSLEQQLFDWEDWNPMDTSDYVFYDATLKQDIGHFKIGDKIDHIFWLGSKSLIILCPKEESSEDSEESLTVKLKILVEL